MNRIENQFKPINFGSVRFGFFPFQTCSNRTAMPRCHPLRINNVVLVVTTSCKKKKIAKKQYQLLAITALIFLDTLQLLNPRPMKENQVNQWKNHQQFISNMASLRDERQKAWKRRKQILLKCWKEILKLYL